jgi:hypothetical protein
MSDDEDQAREILARRKAHETLEESIRTLRRAAVMAREMRDLKTAQGLEALRAQREAELAVLEAQRKAAQWRAGHAKTGPPPEKGNGPDRG